MSQVFKEMDLRKGRRHLGVRGPTSRSAPEGGRSRLAAEGLCFRTAQLCASPVPQRLASQLHENWTRGELARLEKLWVQTQTMVSSSEAKGSTFPLHPQRQRPQLQALDPLAILSFLGSCSGPLSSNEPVSRWLGLKSSFLWPLSSPEAPSSTAASTLAPTSVNHSYTCTGSTGSSHSPHPQAAPLAEWSLGSSYRLLSAASAVASLLAAPCATPGLPATRAASCESPFSSPPAKVKPSPLTGPWFTSGLRSSNAAAWLWAWGGYPHQGKVSTPRKPEGRDQGMFCSQKLKKGRETQAQAVGPWPLKSRPFSPRG
ncbi:unnamed protein product [Nyctereutes procyonoides]|uniref:(raccoon dog) hypothetical protein n=1 Tax=Nyctereutes procyonoides TaxID=34880 RepID=A0A811YZI6_NYCPR|nr:unnamed protein product [Nyctereutes procyonoides]